MKEKPAYPLVRFSAALLDGFINLAIIVVYAKFMHNFQIGSTYISFLILITIIYTYESFLVSRFNGTIGHKLFKLKVTMNDENNSSIGFPRALVRFFLRWFIGILSFFWILGSKRQALHDILTKTKVYSV